MSMLPSWAMDAMNILTQAFILAVGLAVLIGFFMYVADITQTRDAVRRNYPLFGRFRSLFTTLGEFFRQYFFAMDREELPFNRAERDWVYRSSEGKGGTIPFGSTKPMDKPGTAIFVNCPFPLLDDHAAETRPMRIGPQARTPYDAPSFFNISGMSYGALSKPAVRALSRGAAKAGIWMNTGEGGLSPMHLEGGCDIVFQIGTAKYGVRNAEGGLSDSNLRKMAAHEQVRMFELKLSQGAKPGKGGILPAEKVTRDIAAIRGIPVGQESISPNRHPEFDDIGGLLDMIGHIREVTGKPVGFKAVIGAYGWLEEMCEEITKRGPQSAPDFFTIDSGDGGTGAAPMALMDNVGLTIRESLPIAVTIFERYGLKDRVRIIASGKLLTPGSVAWALAAGADFIQCGRGFMFSLGCIQALKCHQNTCPTGVTTHKKSLQRGLVVRDKAERVAVYADTVRKHVEMIAHSCGVPEPRRLGRKHVRIVQTSGRSLPMTALDFLPDDDTPNRLTPVGSGARDLPEQP
ncbi:MAG: FMN-binding glutamate synthase family protein [Maricaulis sp.]|nr:FMN-binding glutamate synthase family protein [Maricaulis sp.]MDF1767642.1 FMN-binding glutamate synthase family protein [Maricaulis sp.]